VALIAFGPFEVDTRSGELRRRGVKIRLQEQPFQILVILLEHAGEVVVRDDLIGRLWPDNTFVDFDRGLNKAINRLREALGDSADKPRFIETLPQRGYRFLAQVTAVARGASNGEEEHGPMLPPHALRIDSLAVLPLDNLSGDPSQEYFSDGMTDELIAAISRIKLLRVISRTSVMRYKGAGKSLPEIARELRVDAVVEGSVMRSGDRVRIITQLIYIPEDKHLWSGRYERELRDILQLQAEIAQEIASQIQKLVDPKLLLPGRPIQINPQAYELALKASYFHEKFTPMDLARSADLYRQAIAIDPTYAQAHANLSQAYFYQGLFGLGPCSDLFRKAKTSALKALELDENVAAAQNALAAIHVLYDWDWANAESVCRRGVELRPSDAAARQHLADYMSIQSRHDEAIAESRKALESNPISRVSLGHLGLLLYRARRYDESIAQCQKTLDIDPHYCNAMWFMALAQEQKGLLSLSIANLEQSVSLCGGPLFLALLSRAYALSGERTKALEILDRIKTLSHQTYVSPFDIAVIQIGVGDLTSAFEQLEEAYRQRVFRLVELTMPMFDNLRPDPRWKNLVRRIGLPLN
jgi:TolB-like protein/Tfp pilus assembly protein PilF